MMPDSWSPLSPARAGDIMTMLLHDPICGHTWERLLVRKKSVIDYRLPIVSKKLLVFRLPPRSDWRLWQAIGSLLITVTTVSSTILQYCRDFQSSECKKCMETLASIHKVYYIKFFKNHVIRYVYYIHIMYIVIGIQTKLPEAKRPKIERPGTKGRRGKTSEWTRLPGVKTSGRTIRPDGQNVRRQNIHGIKRSWGQNVLAAYFIQCPF